MIIKTGYHDAREEKEAITFILEVAGKEYKIREEAGRMRISSSDGVFELLPQASNVIEIGTKEF